MALIAVLFLAVYFASICAVGYVVFSPFKAALSAKPSEDMRFTVMDILAAFMPFAIGYASLNGFYPDIDWNTDTSTLFCVVALVITGVSWFYGMRLLKRLRTDDTIRRIVLLGIVMPAGFVVPVVTLPILINVQWGAQSGYRFAVLVCIIYALRILTLWIRAGSTAIATQIPDA